MNKRTFFSLFSLATVTFFLLQNTSVFAATPTPTAQSSAVADAEIEREKQITKELSLNMPDQTEDPNYPITFIDPSKQGVDITIDDKTTAKAPNPFLLPNLAIGEHKIIFKFKTKDGVVRVLTKKLLVTPKAPQFDQTLKTEVIKPATVALKGTALPQSTIMIVINSDKTHKITSTVDGKWEFIVPEPQEGKNNIIAFAIKNGIVSNASKTFTVSYHQNAIGAVISSDGENKEHPAIMFAKTVLNNIDANRRERPTIFYGVIGAAFLIVIIAIDLRLRKRAARNRDDKTIEALFGTLQKDGGTIVEAIQSVKENASKKLNKKAVTKTIVKEAQAVTNEVPTPDKKAAPPVIEKPMKKVKKVVVEQKKSEPLEVTPEISDETEEPEKKVLTKEEFLKQFQKGDGQGE